MELRKKHYIIAISFLLTILGLSSYFLGRYHGGNVTEAIGIKRVERHKTSQVNKGMPSGRPKQPSTKVKAFRISKQTSSIMGLRTEKITIGKAEMVLDFTGKLAYNKDTLSYITAKQSGIVKEVFRTVGDEVRTGDSLLRLESIQLGKAQQDYLNSKALFREAKKNYHRARSLYEKRIISENQYLKEASNFRIHRHHVQNAMNELKILGYKDIYTLEAYHGINPNISLHSPLSGQIIERYANLGEMISPRKPAYKIANLNSLWLYLDVYEKDFRYFRRGLKLHFTPVSYPDRDFHAIVDYLNSEVTGKSRTIKVRARVSNENGILLPNMYVRAKLKLSLGDKKLMIPSSAVIDTGKRQITFVSLGKGKYIPRIIVLGKRIGDYNIVHSGVKEGESVVVTANFLLDSETQAKGYLKELGDTPSMSTHKH